jgi:hypothetical protein
VRVTLAPSRASLRVAKFILETSIVTPFHPFLYHLVALDAAVYMFFVSVLRNALCILVPLSFLLSSYLYLYPAFHLCAFPAPEDTPNTAFLNTLRQHTFSSHNASKIAPFRLLALGDPQLEGESSIPDAEAATFPHFTKFWQDAFLLNGTKHNPLQRLRHSLHDLIDFYLDDIPKALEVYRKRVDHIGNDYYLGHIYRTLHWWTDPSHVTVLGDLVGSQWIDDAEFDRRGWRYWNRVFRGGIRVSEEVASQPAEDFQDTRILGEDVAIWKRRIINVAGNHDIGYAGDLSPERMARFTRVFGKANYELRFQLPLNSTVVATLSQEIAEGATDSENDEVIVDGESEEIEYKPVPELRIIVLNDMNLDTPASSKELQDETYNFLNQVITTSHDVTRPAHFTLVLTHIPMYKQAGICVDGPFFDFFDGDFDNGVKEQNHLSADASKGFLEGIYGMSGDAFQPGHGFGRHGLVLNGHDHEGCDVYHFINQSEPPERYWKAARWADAEAGGYGEEAGVVGLREVTVRSMMGDFGGNAGLLSLWFDEETWDWRFEFVNCKLGTQHIWWVVHILDLITLGVGIAYAGLLLAPKVLPTQRVRDKHLGNGYARHPEKNKNGTVHLQKINGKLDSPGQRKKSKATIHGESPSKIG